MDRPIVVVVVDGPMGAGKTTLLERFAERNPRVSVAKEPLDRLTSFYDYDVHPRREYNPLRRMYENPRVDAVAAQLHIVKTFAERDGDVADAAVIVTDRHVDSCFPFVRVKERLGQISSFAADALDRAIVDAKKTHAVAPRTNVFYLDTPIDVCLARVLNRERPGEEFSTEERLTDASRLLNGLREAFDRFLETGNVPYVKVAVGDDLDEAVGRLERYVEACSARRNVLREIAARPIKGEADAR